MMNIPVISVGFASLGASIDYCPATKQFCYSVCAFGFSKVGVVYNA